MTTSPKSMRASLVIISAVSCVAMFTDTSLAASKNFAARCEQIIGNNVKALAIEPAYSNQQLCACARTNQELRRQLSATGMKCNESTITNFNQAVATPPDTEPPNEPPTEPPAEPALKGNNGWGNGGEGINNGSDNGTLAQSSTKSADSRGGGER
ncbi:MAG TPA: hypothetical protein VKA79_04185 [Aestuariivirgaceae bacterium]|nr:hypothetical protein [Aestuariivirgaceae bacterium]